MIHVFSKSLFVYYYLYYEVLSACTTRCLVAVTTQCAKNIYMLFTLALQ